MTNEEIAQISALIAPALRSQEDRVSERNLQSLHESIQSLERIAVAHQAAIEDLKDGIEVLRDAAAAQQASIERLARTTEGSEIESLTALWKDLTTQWEAYLRRLPPN